MMMAIRSQSRVSIVSAIRRRSAIAVFSAVLFCAAASLRAQETANPNAPVVKKVEPPNWWIGLSEDLLVLLTGKNLQATHANCNLPEVLVSRTMSSGNG